MWGVGVVCGAQSGRGARGVLCPGAGSRAGSRAVAAGLRSPGLCSAAGWGAPGRSPPAAGVPWAASWLREWCGWRPRVRCPGLRVSPAVRLGGQGVFYFRARSRLRGRGGCGRVTRRSRQQLLRALRSLQQQRCSRPPPVRCRRANQTSSDLCGNLQLRGFAFLRGADNGRFVFAASGRNSRLWAQGASVNSGWFPVSGSPFTMS